MKSAWLSASRLFALAAVACLVGFVGWSLRDSWAQDDAAEAADEAEAADAAEAEAAFAEIPEGDAEAIVEFIDATVEAEAPEGTEDEQLADAMRRLRLIAEASGRLIEADPNEEQLVQGHSYRLQALQGLTQLGDEEAAEDFPAAIEVAMDSPVASVARAGWENFLYLRLAEWATLDDEAKDAVAKRIINEVTGDEPERFDVVLLYMVAGNLDHIDDAFAEKVLAATLPTLQESGSRDVQEALAEANLEGKLRRYNLLGQPMEVSGELLGGGEVDWESYRGKVVLVDFWATWCGPCRGEVPNILQQYEAYHDKGFEVLGVSLDDTPEAAQEYIAEMELPWASLFSSNEDERSWNHPLARYYGIGGIPTAILVDQEGRVVDMDARGPRLRELLVELLGEPSEPAEPSESEADSADEPAEATEASGG